MKLRIGISTCPNDTFAFHGILSKAVDMRGLELDIRLLDVEELNRLSARGELDISKVSFHAAMHLDPGFEILPVGAALGFGVGPIMVAKCSATKLDETTRVVCPGAWTTAALLVRCFHPEVRSIGHLVFSEIVPAIKAGQFDAGVLIHEGRFTYEEAGLTLLADLGDEWERATAMPLPLGGLIADRRLPRDVVERFVATVRDSIRYAEKDRAGAEITMKHYAQEFDADVLWKHVELYVNAQTFDLGEHGRAALSELRRRAEAAGVV